MLLDGYLISYFQTGLKNLLDRVILDSTDFHGQFCLATLLCYVILTQLIKMWLLRRNWI